MSKGEPAPGSRAHDKPTPRFTATSVWINGMESVFSACELAPSWSDMGNRCCTGRCQPIRRQGGSWTSSSPLVLARLAGGGFRCRTTHCKSAPWDPWSVLNESVARAGLAARAVLRGRARPPGGGRPRRPGRRRSPATGRGTRVQRPLCPPARLRPRRCQEHGRAPSGRPSRSLLSQAGRLGLRPDQVLYVLVKVIPGSEASEWSRSFAF